METAQINNESMPKGIRIPFKELTDSKTLALNSDPIELWTSHQKPGMLLTASGLIWVEVLLVLKIKQSEKHNRQRSHSHIIKLIDEGLVKRLT